MGLVRSALTPEKISRAYDIISYGSATIERRSNGEDWVTITSESASELRNDLISYEGVALIVGDAIALPLTTFLSIMAPTRMGDGSLRSIDSYPLHLSGRAFLNEYLPSRIEDRLIIPTSSPKPSSVESPTHEENIPTALRNIQGLNYQPVPGDGHCLYHAIALYLGEDQTRLRARVANHLQANLENFREFIDLPEGQAFDDYIRAIRNGAEWADNIEIEVLMRIFNRPIAVIGPDGNIRNQDVFERFNGEPIFVYYNGHNHYDALLLRQGYSVQQVREQLALTIARPNPSLSKHSTQEKSNELIPPAISNRPSVEESNRRLIGAAARGDCEEIKAAFREGANVETINYDSTLHMRALHYAAVSGHAEAVKLLLSLGANDQAKTFFGSTAHDLSQPNGSVDELFKMRRDKKLVDARDRKLIDAAVRGNCEEIRAALREGANIEAIDYDTSRLHLNPLHYAAVSGHAEAVRLLLSLGADVKAKISSGSTARDLSKPQGSVDELFKMSDKKLMNAAVLGNCEEIRAALREGANIEAIDYEPLIHLKPLHYAAVSGHAEAVRLLLSLGADPLAKTSNGFTARDLSKPQGSVDELFKMSDKKLMNAAVLGNCEEIRAALREGANIEAIDYEPLIHLKPLHYAAVSGHAEAVRLLLSLGADPQAKTSNGYTARELSTQPNVLASLPVSAKPPTVAPEPTPVVQPAPPPAPPMTKKQQRQAARAERKAHVEAVKNKRKECKAQKRIERQKKSAYRKSPEGQAAKAARRAARTEAYLKTPEGKKAAAKQKEHAEKAAHKAQKRRVEMIREHMQIHYSTFYDANYNNFTVLEREYNRICAFRRTGVLASAGSSSASQSNGGGVSPSSMGMFSASGRSIPSISDSQIRARESVGGHYSTSGGYRTPSLYGFPITSTPLPPLSYTRACPDGTVALRDFPGHPNEIKCYNVTGFIR